MDTNLVGETITHWSNSTGTWQPDVTGTVRAADVQGVMLEVQADALNVVAKGSLVRLFVVQSPTERLMVGWPPA